MPLNLGQLISDLKEAHSSENQSNTSYASLFTNAVISYWETGMAPGAGMVIAAPARGIIQSTLTAVHAPSASSRQVTAVQIATALNTGLSSVIISGGLYGMGPCLPLGLGGLISDLTDAYAENTQSVSSIAQLEATAIDTFTKATLCIGTGVEVPVKIPKIGPLS